MNIIHYLGTGVYHEDNRIPCQDFANHCYADNGNIIMALSDGCSSAACAEDASRLTVESVISYFEKHTVAGFEADKNAPEELLCHIRGAFEKAGKKQYAASPSRYSATLLFAVMDSEKVLLGHIGDGNIVCCDRRGNITAYSAEENGSASNQTFFTVDDDAADHFRTEVLPRSEVADLIMYSDGPQKMFYFIGNKKNEAAAAGLLTEVYKGEIADCAALSDRLTYLTGDAMYQLMDDWSMLIYDEAQPQCADISFRPISMKQNFMKGFRHENRQ